MVKKGGTKIYIVLVMSIIAGHVGPSFSAIMMVMFGHFRFLEKLFHASLRPIKKKLGMLNGTLMKAVMIDIKKCNLAVNLI